MLKLAFASFWCVSACIRVCVASPALDPTVQSEVAERLASENAAVWIADGRVYFAARLQGDTVHSIAVPSVEMAPIGDTGTWVGVTDMERADEAMIGAGFYAIKDGLPMPGVLGKKFRGPSAPPEPERATSLTGNVATYAIETPDLGGLRSISVYTPPNTRAQDIERIVIQADGRSIKPYAKLLEPLILSGKLPPTAILGVATAARGTGEGPAADSRSIEYLKGFHERDDSIDPERFDRHFGFFIHDVPAWAARVLKIDVGPKDRIVYGVSNGGAFAATVAALAPDQIGGAIACSPGWRRTHEFFSGPGCPLFISAGLYEPEFLKSAMLIEEAAKKAGRVVELEERAAGHDPFMWQEQYVRGLLWLEGQRD